MNIRVTSLRSVSIRRALAPAGIALLLGLAGCGGTPDIDNWRSKQATKAEVHAAGSALSSLEYARGMAKTGGESADSSAQLAWALGTTTHLQPMMDRAKQATETMKTIQRALSLNPEQPTALAALAILHLRLATLPWIAKVLASGAPDGPPERAEEAATRTVKVRPSMENRIILAKCLIAAEKNAEARKVLEEALAANARFPRDTALRPDGARLLKTLAEE